MRGINDSTKYHVSHQEMLSEGLEQRTLEDLCLVQQRQSPRLLLLLRWNQPARYGLS